MFKTSLFAAAVATLGLTATSHSATVRIDCAYGEMTLSRLADGECTARIPLPTPRPEAVAAKQDRLAAPAPVVKPEYIEFTNDRGETKMIRLVGPRFLPEDEMDLRVHSSNHPTDSVLSLAIAYFGFGSSETDVVAEGVQEARAELIAESVTN